jgi:hypothetical protein
MLTILAAVAPAVPMPATPSITPQSRTLPTVEASCKISSPQGQQFDLSFRQSGGRGFSRTNASGFSYVDRTEVKLDVVKDTAGILNGYEFERSPKEAWPGAVRGFKHPGRDIQIESLNTGMAGRLALLVRLQWPMNFVDFLGFCDVKKMEQVPLSEVEAEKARKQ